MKETLKAAFLNLFPENENTISFNDTLTGFSLFFFGIKAIEAKFFKTKCYLCFEHEDDAKKVPFQDAEIVQDRKALILSEYENCKGIDRKNREDRAETFGCCNDFLNCSNAKECIHQDDDFYLGCMYRKNLESGKIFYGVNCNV